MKKKNIVQLALLASVVVVSSCASKKDLDNCQRENRELNESYRSTREQLAASQARVTSLEEQLAQQKRDYAALQGSLDKSLNNSSANNVNISKLVDQINESNQYIRHLVEVKSKSDSLNMVLTNNLTRSLSREELKEVDVRVLKGVVYISLADNMLYKSGSYEINDRAAETLSKIAKIIMDYQDYDVLVEGNTDNVPINRENIRNNWDLSCLRASSVVSLTPLPPTEPKWANNVTAARKSSSRRTWTSLWILSTKHPKKENKTSFFVPQKCVFSP